MTSRDESSRTSTIREHRAVSGPLLVACAIIAAFIVLACVVQNPSLRRLFDNIHWTLAYATAATLAWIGVRRASGETLRPRRWFAWALTTYTAAQFLWVMQEATGWQPFPAPSDALFILLGPLCGAGFLSALRQRCSREQLRAALLDSAGLAVAVLALVLVLYLPRQGENSVLAMAVLVAYPVVLTFTLGLSLITTLRLQLKPQPGRALFLLALLGQAWIWLEWIRRALYDLQVDGGPFNAMFSIVALAQGLGVMSWDFEGAGSRRWSQFCDSVLRLLPLIIVVLSAVAVVLTHVLMDVPELVSGIVLVAGMIVVSLAAVRQHVLMNEGERLLELERALRLGEETFRAVVDQAGDGIFVGSMDGVILEASQRGAALLGMSREELIGLPVHHLVPPEQAERTAEDMRKLNAGEEIAVERLVQRKDGTQLHVEVRAKPLSGGRLLATWRDVTESKLREEQLRQRQKMEAVGTLAAGIAHDFNNLLMTIRGYADMAGADLAPRHAAHSSIDEIRKASARAAQLVRQILTFSQPAKPKMEMVRLQDVVDDVMGLLRSTLPAGVGLFTDFEHGAPPVLADATQLHQVVVNLCTNAWHAMEGEPGRIDISVTSLGTGRRPMLGLAPGRYVCLRVSDSGRGMDAETRQRIFEPFFTTKRVQGGTGLGLSVVHGIVRNHSGGIDVQSSPGTGTVISMYLPAAASVAPASVGAFHDSALQDAIIEGPVPGAYRVLFVDDEPSHVALAVQEIQRRGYGVQGCTSPRDALTFLVAAVRPFDLVVSDQNMPDISGLELMREIKVLQPSIKCLLISGVVDSRLLASAAMIGIDRVIGKPVTFDELGGVIQSILAG